MRSKVLESIEELWTDETRRKFCHDIWTEIVYSAKKINPNGLLKTYDTTDVKYANKNHQIVQWLEKSANLLKCPNLHIGLTSSDIEENARLIQILKTVKLLEGVLRDVRLVIQSRLHARWLGKTHLRNAGVTDNRHLMWKQCLECEIPKIYPKEPSGIIGCYYETPDEIIKVLKYVKWDKLGFEWGPRDSDRQSTDMKVELSFCHYLSEISAGVVKICNDIRYLVSTGEIEIEDNTASSSDPSKVNPTKFEKAQSICYTIGGTYSSVWNVMAHDGLEGTLTRRWCLDHKISSASIDLVKALETLRDGLIDCKPTPRKVPKEPFPALKLTRKVVEEGKCRDVCYNQLYFTFHKEGKQD